MELRLRRQAGADARWSEIERLHADLSAAMNDLHHDDAGFESDSNLQLARSSRTSKRRLLMGNYDYYDNQEEEKDVNATEYEWPPCPSWVQQAVNTAYYYCGGADMCMKDRGELANFEDIKDSFKRFIELELQCSTCSRLEVSLVVAVLHTLVIAALLLPSWTDIGM